MTDREEDPTAFSLVVNGQIELAEVRKLKHDEGLRPTFLSCALQS